MGIARSRLALIVVLLALTASPAFAATQLRLYAATIDLDPNGNLWHVSSKLCNKDTVPSGSILYRLRLYTDVPGHGGRYYNIGAVKSPDPIQPGKCRERPDMAIKVNTQSVPSGTYHIVLFVGDWNGSTFTGDIQHQFGLDFTKN
jgi:hypothetical protein